jgi:hypothetical protein
MLRTSISSLPRLRISDDFQELGDGAHVAAARGHHD